MTNFQLPSPFPVSCHTDHVGPGSTFVAIDGFHENGIDYLPQAIAQGAACIVVQKNAVISAANLDLIKKRGITVKHVVDIRLVLAQLSARAADYPAKKLKIIGITGTKGKTTTSFLLAHILRAAGYKTALLSTVNNMIDNQLFMSPLTTPQPDYLHQFIKQAYEAGTTHVVMEVAAQALTMQRVAGIEFDGIIFTNFSQEHLEFYNTLDDYFQAKCLLFKQAKPCAPLIINGDDDYCRRLRFPNAIWLSMKKQATICGQLLNDPLKQIDLSVVWQKETVLFSCPSFVGSFNGYNMLNAVAMALQLGISPRVIAAAIKTFAGVPGRMEKYMLPNGAMAIIDYAHNPASYQEILLLLAQITPHLIVIFGAGGNRDKTKRPLMGNIAAQFADKVILTTDNPRTEDPQQIIYDIMQGVPKDLQHKIVQELDREEAIQKGYYYSHRNSIIALLGKGNEEYQLIGDKKVYFSEKSILQQLV